eukprot:jgi/Mesvir1/3729/Mv15005-RA.1
MADSPRWEAWRNDPCCSEAMVKQMLQGDGLAECSRAAVFDSEGKVIYATGFSQPPHRAELLQLMAALSNRETAMREGLVLEGKRYEAHRHHPPIVYGRMISPDGAGGADTGDGDGIAVCSAMQSLTGRTLCIVVTYSLPALSARIVPKLLELCKALEAMEACPTSGDCSNCGTHAEPGAG